MRKQEKRNVERQGGEEKGGRSQKIGGKRRKGTKVDVITGNARRGNAVHHIRKRRRYFGYLEKLKLWTTGKNRKKED